MAGHIKLGNAGEDMAVAYLLNKGYALLHRNWRYSHYEIDIIALKENKLHFIEVKIRSSARFGLPEKAVNKKKFERILAAADEFLYLHPQYRHVQYDVIAISTYNNVPPEIILIEDIYL